MYHLVLLHHWLVSFVLGDPHRFYPFPSPFSSAFYLTGHVGCLFQRLIESSTHHSFTVTFFCLCSRLFYSAANKHTEIKLNHTLTHHTLKPLVY